MPADAVIDASVLAAAFFNEKHSAAARAWLGRDHRLCAPGLLRIEIASIAAKKVWLNEIDARMGEAAMTAIGEVVAEFEGDDNLTTEAYRLSAAHRFSAYDGVYLALAQRRGVRVVTLDGRLARRAGEVGLDRLVNLLV